MRLKDWLKTGLLYGAIVVGASFVYGFLINQSDMTQTMNAIVMYMLAFGAGLGVALNILMYKTMLPVALSFGSTRKEAFAGIQCYRLVYTVLVIGAALPLSLMAGDVGRFFVPFGIGLMLLLTALGAVLGMLGGRFGRGVKVVVGVAGGLLASGALFGGIIGAAMLDERIGAAGLWVLPVIGLVAYVVASVFEHKAVYQYSVKL